MICIFFKLTTTISPLKVPPINLSSSINVFKMKLLFNSKVDSVLLPILYFIDHKVPEYLLFSIKLCALNKYFKPLETSFFVVKTFTVNLCFKCAQLLL